MEMTKKLLIFSLFFGDFQSIYYVMFIVSRIWWQKNYKNQSLKAKHT